MSRIAILYEYTIVIILWIALTCWARNGDVKFPVMYGQTYRVESSFK
jgi:hypothetical protein